MSPTRLREHEGVADDSLDAFSREDTRLDCRFARQVGMDAASRAGVLPLGVLAHEDHVDVGRAAASERARYAFE